MGDILANTALSDTDTNESHGYAAGEKVVNDKQFPDLITGLPAFAGPFDAYQLNAKNCEVLFASYPAGTEIEPHTHATENCGVITQGELFLTVDGTERRYGPGDWYHLMPEQEHSARFEVETSEIEFWFGARNHTSDRCHDVCNCPTCSFKSHKLGSINHNHG